MPKTFTSTTFRMFLTLAFVSTLFVSRGQTKTLTIGQAMNRDLYPKTLINLQWRNNEQFSWLDRSGVMQQTAFGKTDTLLTLRDLNRAFARANLDTLTYIPYFQWKTENSICFVSNNQIFVYDVTTRQARKSAALAGACENLDYHPATEQVAYTIQNNLYVNHKGIELVVTTGSDEGIVNGSERVHRNEWGIEKGTFWSPKGTYLAYYRMDERQVAQYPLVDVNGRIGRVENIRYPMAGEKSHEVTLRIFSPSTMKNVIVKSYDAEPDHYLTSVSWSPDEKYIFLAILNRAQNHLWFNKYDVETGDLVKTLFEETDEQYVEPMNGITFLKTNPNQFVWQSRRDGWNHLYLYDTDGNLIRQLTKGPWEVTEFEGFDASETKLFYTSTQQSAIERQLYMLDLKKNTTRPLTTRPGTHTIFLSPDGNYFIDRYSSLHFGSEYTVCKVADAKSQLIVSDPNPLKDYKLGKTELLTLKASNGDSLYARIIKPLDFDASKKYPVLLYVYGGPHSQLVTNTWLGGSNLFFQFLATQGYIVFTLDNHGTGDRGAEFEQTIHRRLGTVEMDDQLQGVKYLKSLNYVDSTRIGLDGWSYGGFMTLTLFLRNPGVFKMATCGGPVVDWKWYEVMYGERYMGTPQNNPEGYENSSTLKYVENMKGKLMIIHDAMDHTVVWQNSLQFLNECIKKGKQADYFVYPNHDHNVSGKDRLHLYQKLWDYYRENL